MSLVITEELILVLTPALLTCPPLPPPPSSLPLRQMAQGRDAAYATTSKVMVDNLALTDGQEGIRAFIEKRKPVWSHTADKAHD